jgi:eukaryotic-like serine/threonine-protein kinase
MKIRLLATLFFITWSISIPLNAMAGDGVDLRSQPQQISDNDVKSVFIKYNFFDRTKNTDGAFVNDFMDNGDGTVTDRATGRMWQKNGSTDGMMWQQAGEYVKKLNSNRFAGHTDWRVPTIEELASLMKPLKPEGELYIDPVFSDKQDICWSSDTFGSDTAWYASFKAGMIRHSYLFFYYVRAVRTLQ